MFEEVLGIWGNALILFAALAVLAWASYVTINNSAKVVDITRFGRTTVGLILFSFSTSLPEFFVAIFAASRQEAAGVFNNTLTKKSVPFASCSYRSK